MHRPQREPARSSTTGTRRPAHRWTHPPSEARRSSPHPTRQPDLSPAELRAFASWMLGGMPAPSERVSPPTLTAATSGPIAIRLAQHADGYLYHQVPIHPSG
jgi:hypothetical protein